MVSSYCRIVPWSSRQLQNHQALSQPSGQQPPGPSNGPSGASLAHGDQAGTESQPATQPPKLLDQVRQRLRVAHYSKRTEEAYVNWIVRFILFHNKRPA